MKLIATREEAVARLLEILESIKDLHPQSSILIMNYRNEWFNPTETMRFKRGKKTWDLVVKWGLENELANHKNRDYVLLHSGEISSVQPRSEKRLFKLAVFHGVFQLVTRYFYLIRLKHLTFLFYGVRFFEQKQFDELAPMVLEKFPTMTKTEAKIIVNKDYLIKAFYPAIAHFGAKLYHWILGDYGFNKMRCYRKLIKVKCLADEKALNTAVSWTSRRTVVGILAMGVELSQKAQESIEEYSKYWLLYTDKQVLQNFVRYGIDPDTLHDDFPAGSFDERIRSWLEGIKKGRIYSDLKYYQKCLPRIKEAEPETYKKLMQRNK